MRFVHPGNEEMAAEVCEYCLDPLCGGECKPHPGAIISIAGLMGFVLILLFVALRSIVK